MLGAFLCYISKIIYSPYYTYDSQKFFRMPRTAHKHVCLLSLWILLFYFLTQPVVAHGAILINEIAWMGTSVSPTDEWIELYNDSNEPVSVEGWTLEDNNALAIELTGTIRQGGFAVLERTDDGSVEGKAFLTYTGALSNKGKTLTLRRPDNSVEDQVVGGDNWENIGGDNVTKETAQWVGTRWVTTSPTPGEANTAPAPRPSIRASNVAAVPSPLVITESKTADHSLLPSRASQTQSGEEERGMATNREIIALRSEQNNSSRSTLSYLGLVCVITIAIATLYTRKSEEKFDAENI